MQQHVDFIVTIATVSYSAEPVKVTPAWETSLNESDSNMPWWQQFCVALKKHVPCGGRTAKGINVIPTERLHRSSMVWVTTASKLM